ncbi:MFS transporter [Aureimonas jatrophae]|uniref:MFS transporter, DHA2 family, multidrug resistance protein n=1 Tax=Aureimonas jatrophae TaxID=1166073 RepID=A0A1H0KX57_9HYPH|nr:MFS transporter [Aureimonas jatrophae]MBB3948916.1 DHA2 family multidrug resistance protein-like MFS transporter [Aureimonas jatrophae]SDO60361.1 MFS transporter, DHA2 family, multidrug resistance protein [Aureimonas jatrophae]
MSSATHDGLPQPARSLAFATIALALFTAVLDGAIANIALPPITTQFGIRPADAVWVVNGYQLAITMALLPLASLGEILGYKRVYLGGLALFTLGSGLCALAGELPFLIAARAIQGLGAAGIMSINIALVRFVFPQNQLGRAVGNVAVVVGVSAAAGPTVAGLILAVAPWQALFLVNVPIGALALFVGWRTLPQTPRSGARFDMRSAVLSAATFGLLISGINDIGHADGAGRAALLIAAGVIVGIVFVRSQLRLPVPMLPVDLLRRPVFALSAVCSVGSFAAQAIAFVSLPFLFHDTLGRSASETGLLLTPWPISTAIAAFISGRLADRLAPGRLAAGGLFLFCAGLVSLTFMPSSPSDADLVWRLALAGFGFGTFQAPNNRLLITSAPRERAGGASGIQSTARLVGQSLGVAMLASIFGLVPDHPIPVALGLAAALAAAGIVPSALRQEEAKREAAHA